jgi:hypothetical protein
MMELYWTPEAIQDRNDIYDYIEADNPTAWLITLEVDEPVVCQALWSW